MAGMIDTERARGLRVPGLILVFLGLSGSVAAEPPVAPIMVIVNTDFAVDSVSSAELADYFSGATPFLPNRVKVQPILAPPPLDAVNTRFLRLLLHTTPRDFRREWEARVYRGETSIRPIQAADILAAARAVLYHTNTIALLDSTALASLPPEFSRGYRILKIIDSKPAAPDHPSR